MNFESIKLNAYGGYLFSANVEEKAEDINLAVLYSNHGDDYLFVKTKDGKSYTYGMFVNLKDVPDEPEKLGPSYVRKPVIYKKINRYCTVSNDTFRSLKSFYEGEGNYKPFYSTGHAQTMFDIAIDALYKAFNSDEFYNLENRRFDMEYALEKNNIGTKDNIMKLADAPFASRGNGGVDGIAGKLEESDDEYLFVDSVIAVFHDGKDLNEKEYIITTDDESDEWGYPNNYFPITQFDSDEKERVRKEIEECISEIKGQLENISYSDNLSYLYEILDNVRGAAYNLYIPTEEEFVEDNYEENE